MITVFRKDFMIHWTFAFSREHTILIREARLLLPYILKHKTSSQVEYKNQYRTYGETRKHTNEQKCKILNI